MTEYYKVSITCTSKSYGGKDDYTVFDVESETFGTLEAVTEFLQERYPTCKRKPMYITHENGKSYICGYVYCFHNDDISHYPVQKCLQQDWVSITYVTETPALGAFSRGKKRGTV